MDNANDNEVHVNVRVRDSRAAACKTPPLTFSIMMHSFSHFQNHLHFFTSGNMKSYVRVAESLLPRHQFDIVITAKSSLDLPILF